MLIWFLDSIYGQISTLGNLSVLAAIIGGGISFALGIFQIGIHVNQVDENQKREIQKGFALLGLSLAFMVLGIIPMIALVLAVLTKMANDVLRGARIAFSSDKKSKN